jgi:hypothetical protein
MLVQAIVEYGIQTGQSGGAASGWGRRLAGAPGGVWAIVAGIALLGLWLLLGRSSTRGLSATRLAGLGLLLAAAYLGSEHLGLTHFGSPFR